LQNISGLLSSADCTSSKQGEQITPLHIEESEDRQMGKWDYEYEDEIIIEEEPEESGYTLEDKMHDCGMSWSDFF